MIEPWASDPVRIHKPKALILDNAQVHLNMDVLRKCEALKLHFIPLPPNSTPITQPLDKVFFGPFKGALRIEVEEMCKKLRKEATGIPACLPKKYLCDLLHNSINRLGDEEKLDLLMRKSFKSTGIYPLNRAEVLKSKSTFLKNFQHSE